MALTRPLITNLNTAVEVFQDPITVLHGGASSANVDVGFLMNRANGLVSNVALYWNESGNTFVTAFTSNTGATDSNISITSYANVTSNAFIDSIGNVRDMPQNIQTANPYTVIPSDDGKHILYGTSSGNVALPGGSIFSIGQTITVVNNTSTNITISQTTGSTIRLSGTATTGNRTLAQYGIATALCITGGSNPTWLVSGTGLS